MTMRVIAIDWSGAVRNAARNIWLAEAVNGELRRLHRELDGAIRDAYGWHDLDLGHDFVEVETLPEHDRVRYTISPTARKEVLRRLLALNHERAKAEQAALASTTPVKSVKQTRKFKSDASNENLFG